MNPRDTTIKSRLNADKLIVSEIKIDTVIAMIEGNTDSLFIASDIKNKELTTNIQTAIMPGKKLSISLLDWIIDYRDEQWALQHAPALIEIDSLNYYIDSLSLAGNSGDTAQYFMAHGNISRKGQEDFMARIENIDISKINEMFDLGTGTSGYLNMMVELKGSSTDPLINGNFGIDSASYNEYDFPNFGGTVKYGKNQLQLNTLIIPRDSGRLEAAAEIPLKFDLEKMEFSVNENDSVNGNIVVTKIPLVILKSFNLPGDFTGHMGGQINISGTLGSPLPQGNLNLAEASYSTGQYGVDYEDIRLSVNFLPDEIELDTLHIRSEDGLFTGTGKLDFRKVFPEWDISRTELQFDFDEFNLFDHSQFNMQITGDADLSGEQDDLGGMDTGDLAGKAAASILSSQITDFLGDRLNVDYIEVKGGENFEKATLSVGKYITNDLFISYEQRFGETGEKDLATYEVELEYELFKFLFFVLNNSSKHSGFDVIFKFTRK